MKSQKNESKYSADNTGHAKGMQDSATIYSDNVVIPSSTVNRVSH